MKQVKSKNCKLSDESTGIPKLKKFGTPNKYGYLTKFPPAVALSAPDCLSCCTKTTKFEKIGKTHGKHFPNKTHKAACPLVTITVSRGFRNLRSVNYPLGNQDRPTTMSNQPPADAREETRASVSNSVVDTTSNRNFKILTPGLPSYQRGRKTSIRRESLAGMINREG